MLGEDNYTAKPQQVRQMKPNVSAQEAGLTQEEKDAITESEKVALVLKNIKGSQDEARDWIKEVKDAWREYQGENTDGKYRKLEFYNANNYQRYWADTEIMLPGLYTQTPRTVGRPRFVNDPVSKTGAIMIQRFAEYLIANDYFDRNMKSTALEFLHASRATARLFFESRIVKRTKRVYLYEVQAAPESEQGESGESAQQEASEPQQPQMILVDKNGNEPPQDSVIDEDELGMPFYEVEGQEEDSVDPRVYTRPIRFDEIVISCGARYYDDIWAIGYKITITRKKAARMFGSIIDEISNDASDSENVKATSDSKAKPDANLFTYWEWWDKEQRDTDNAVSFVHEKLKDKFLRQIKDPYSLRGFFPSPCFVVANERYCDQYPSPDYTQTRDLYEHLHVLMKRMNAITRAIRGIGIYDASKTELSALFTETADGNGIAVANYKDMLANGSVDQLVWFPPYDRLATTLKTLQDVFALAKQELDELRGISDIIRGQSDPNTSATAEKIKRQSLINRQALREQDMDRFVRDIIEMMIDLGLKTFTENQFKEAIGFAYLEPEDQQRFGQAYDMLKDDKSRMVRIDIETDSTRADAEQEDVQAATQFMDAVSKYLQNTVVAVEQNPDVGPLMYKLLQMVMGAFDLGKMAQDELKESFDKIFQKLNNPPKPTPPEPSPDTLAKLASNERVAQMKEQFGAANDQLERQLKYQQTQMNFVLKRLGIEVQAQNNAQANGVASGTLDLAERTEAFNEEVQGAQLNLDSTELEAKIEEKQALIGEKIRAEQRLEEQNIMIPEEKMQNEIRLAGIEGQIKSFGGQVAPQIIPIVMPGGGQSAPPITNIVSPQATAPTVQPPAPATDKIITYGPKDPLTGSRSVMVRNVNSGLIGGEGL